MSNLFSEVQAKKSVTFGSSKLGDAFGDEVPAALVKLSKAQRDLTAAATVATGSTATAVKSYGDLIDGDTLPAPQEYSAKLAQLETVVGKAQSDVEKSLRARTELLAQLQSLVESNEAMRGEEQQKLADLKAKMSKVLETKVEINDMLMEEGGGAGGEAETKSTTPPAPVEDEDEYRPQPFSSGGDVEAPTYSPISSDDEDDDDEPSAKKAKVSPPEPAAAPAESTESTALADATAAPPATGLEGLDPKVAQFLSSLVGTDKSA